jgi:hypothetical protein
MAAPRLTDLTRLSIFITLRLILADPSPAADPILLSIVNEVVAALAVSLGNQVTCAK